jgi:TatD DNase family protein
MADSDGEACVAAMDRPPIEPIEPAFTCNHHSAEQLDRLKQATLDILEQEGAQAVRGIIHCYSEDRAFARRALDLGFYLSFSGIVTFKKAEAVRDVAAWAPADRILVETDAPFLAPVPYRGKPNEPGFVRFTAAAVAELRGISTEKLAELTTRNLEALCGWAPSS